MPLNWSPKTKLHPPHISGEIIERRRLLALLHDAVQKRRLTLISSPAGSGKTTLAASLAASATGFACAWLTLDRDDNDPIAFATNLVTALQTVQPAWGTAALELLAGMPDAETKLRRMIGLLINDILTAEPAPFLLILDDYHVITEAAIHDACDYLLDHLPPPMRIVISARYDPPLALSRLRAREQLAEFRLFDMRFDAAETAAYLNHRLTSSLTAAEIETLQKQTEGWAAGLQLLAATLNNIAGPVQRSDFISRFSHSNRLIFDLLADEVLNQQPPDLRTFLVQTSILTELTPALCAAVAQNQKAPQLLEEAYRRNLFLAAINEELTPDTVYRYHALFGSFLRQRLKRDYPERVQELHRRAASAEPSPERAIQHYIAAELWAEAAALLEEAGRAAVAKRLVRYGLVERILALPEIIRRQRPWLQLVLGVYYALRGNMEQSELYLEQALAQFRAAGDEVGEIEVLVAECWRAGGLIAAEKLAELAAKIDTVPHLFRPDQVAGYHGAAQWFYQMRYDWPRTTHHLMAGIKLAEQEWDAGAMMTVSSAFGPELLFNQQGMEPVERFVLATLKRVPQQERVHYMLLQFILAYIYFYQGRPAEAEQLVGPAHHTLRQIGGMAWVDGHAAWLRLTLMVIRRQVAALDTFLLETVEMIAENEANSAFLPGFVYLQGRVYWQQGRLSEARACLDRLDRLAGEFWNNQEDQIRQALLKGLLALSDQRYVEAETILRQAVKLHRQVRHTSLLHHPRLALAMLYHQWGQSEAALSEFRTALQEIRQQGKPGIILQEGEPVIPLLQLARQHHLEPALISSLLEILDQAKTPGPILIPTQPKR